MLCLTLKSPFPTSKINCFDFIYLVACPSKIPKLTVMDLAKLFNFSVRIYKFISKV